jgi:hypothetical protein
MRRDQDEARQPEMGSRQGPGLSYAAPRILLAGGREHRRSYRRVGAGVHIGRAAYARGLCLAIDSASPQASPRTREGAHRLRSVTPSRVVQFPTRGIQQE